MDIRRAATLLATTLLATTLSSAGSGAGAVAPATVAAVAATVPFDPAPLTGRCRDQAGVWASMRWSGRLRWQLNTDSIPGYLADRDAVVDTARVAATAVAAGRNDCGLPENLAIDQRYAGPTTRRANVTATGACGHRDGRNVVSFGRLAPGLLAVTCVFWEDRGSGRADGRSVEADILIDSAAGSFFLALPPDCHARWDLEGILTHEFGHVFGLGHVPFPRHGAQTMSERLPECSTAYRGLGLGDYLILRSSYGTA